MSPTARRIALVCWLLLAGNLIFAMAISGWSARVDQVGLLLSLVGYLLLSMVILPAVLAALHRASLDHWWIWALLIGLWIVGGTAGQSSGLPSSLALAGNLIFLGSWVGMLVGTSILLFTRDVALFLIGILSLAGVWTAAISWRIRGDLIGEMLRMIYAAPGAGRSLFWVSVLFATMLCLVPIAAVGFIVQTILAIRRELRGDPLSATISSSNVVMRRNCDEEEP